MKRIVSVSLGSSKRNHEAEIDVLGEKFLIERIGTNGDIDEAIRIIKSLDGKVDAFGMGGIDLYLYGSNKRYVIKDAIQIKEAAVKTPIVDGSGLKNTLERRVIRYINDNVLTLRKRTVLMVSAVDRFGMAEALHEAEADITFGDIIFGLNIPIPIKSYKVFHAVADTLLPFVVRMPFEKLYPTGKEQEITISKYEKYYDSVEIIAGDYLFIKKYMPLSMHGKIVITNTVTPDDVKDLRERGVRMLITTTPEFSGRSFGTNVMEALIVSIIGKNVEEILPCDYDNLFDKLHFIPRIEHLNKAILKEAR